MSTCEQPNNQISAPTAHPPSCSSLYLSSKYEARTVLDIVTCLRLTSECVCIVAAAHTRSHGIWCFVCCLHLASPHSPFHTRKRTRKQYTTHHGFCMDKIPGVDLKICWSVDQRSIDDVIVFVLDSYYSPWTVFMDFLFRIQTGDPTVWEWRGMKVELKSWDHNAEV